MSCSKDFTIRILDPCKDKNTDWAHVMWGGAETNPEGSVIGGSGTTVTFFRNHAPDGAVQLIAFATELCVLPPRDISIKVTNSVGAGGVDIEIVTTGGVWLLGTTFVGPPVTYPVPLFSSDGTFFQVFSTRSFSGLMDVKVEFIV
jgi:hypothetical protein